MEASASLNAKLEAALSVEFVVADNLREQIYEAIAELNSITMRPVSAFAPEDESFKSENEDNITEQGSQKSAEDFHVDELDAHVEEANDFEGSEQGVKFTCFPSNHTDSRTNTNLASTVPAAKLSYLNHAEILRKYSGNDLS
eukprot:CAMPEP_0184975636 /NCGR_PEP_ID=MMETSP1098-20130426/6834_1 /TAXON_ID=89044 /ORGANISM="Spumella elongata, Strain CCAP 955/1" /LENGTH=141 /DNA_ID=CAMNT_0027498399 /DNA_START=20 /DNA_END=442 /DNA_ORIENTATION=+